MPLISGLIFIIAVIFIEIAGFVIVGRHIGVMATLGLVLAAMFFGVGLLRFQGKGMMQRIARDLESGRMPDRPVIEGMMLVIACILLIIPGFVSDIFGLLLFIPPLRLVLWRYIAKYVTSSTKFYSRTSSKEKNADHGIIIELQEDEYQTQENKKSPWHRRNDEKNGQ